MPRTTYQKALDLADQLGEYKGKAIILSTLGVVLYSQKNKQSALSYLKEALILAEQLDDATLLEEIQNKLASLIRI